ncbi:MULTISPECIES: hypothetical protein [unclassified Roseibium]|uniref:hypothetical protein n=1 Tax=unclassified Roseibium TaxID=2629323 RepID=UPI00273FE62F|nr:MULTISPECIES: hypothetical protein [unclassified Roseibium]
MNKPNAKKTSETYSSVRIDKRPLSPPSAAKTVIDMADAITAAVHNTELEVSDLSIDVKGDGRTEVYAKLQKRTHYEPDRD